MQFKASKRRGRTISCMIGADKRIMGSHLDAVVSLENLMMTAQLSKSKVDKRSLFTFKTKLSLV